MKKYFLISIFLFTSFSVWAECPEGTGLETAQNFASSMLVPNCFQTTYIDPTKKKNPNYDQLCNTCKPQFIENSSKLGIQLPTSKNFIADLAKEEFAKSIGFLITDLIKLRTSDSFTGKFSSSEQSCNLTTIVKNLEKINCDSNPIREIQKNALDEVAFLLSKPSKSSANALLDRSEFKSTNQQCSKLSESEILHLKSELLLDNIDEVTIEKLSTINNIKDISDQFEGASSIQSDLIGHPFFSNLMKDMSAFKKFWATLPRPVTKKEIKGHISQSTEALDKIISENCSKSVDAYTKLACNKNSPNEFKQPNIIQSRQTLEPTSNEFLNDEDLKSGTLEKNLSLLKLCELTGTRDLAKELAQISPGLPIEYQNAPLAKYKQNKFRNEIQATRESLCEIEKDPKDCKNDSSFNCRLQNAWNDLKKETSTVHRMANSSDESINSLIRSVLGNPKDASPETRQVLVANGILPKSDGKFVEQPKVPEREPNYYQKTPSSNVPSVATTTTIQTQRLSSTGSAQQNDSFYNPAPASIGSSTETAAYEAPISPSILQSMKDLSQINGEIARRLLGNNSQAQSSISRSDVRSIAESVLKDQQQTPPSTAMVDNAVEDFYNEINQKLSPVGGGFGPSTAGPVKRTQKEMDEFRKAQMNKALEGMGQGSRDVAMANVASDFSVKVQDGKDKEAMSKVEVFTSADKLEKVNLAEILKLKGQKDAEGKRLVELVKKKENFILNVNKTSLMVKFNDSKDGFEIIRIGSSGTKIDDKVVSEVRSFIKDNYSGVALSDLRKNLQ